MKSLRAKMTIMIVLVVLGSSTLVSLISYQRAKQSLTLQLEDNYEVAAQKYALELTSWVNTNATIIDTLAAEIAVNNISSQDYDAFHKYLKHSNELLNKNGYVYDVYFTYPNNFMVCASDFLADGSVDFVHEREWYTTSALTGELYYADPYLDSDTGKPVITISKAVYSSDGTLLGVLAADIFVDTLVDRINSANTQNNSYAFLMDQNLKMLVHPNKFYEYEDVPYYIMDAPDAPYQDLVNAVNAHSDDMVFVKDYDGITRGIVTSQMTNTGWYVCFATSQNELQEGVASLMRSFVITTIFEALIAFIIAIFLSRVLDRLNKQETEYRQQVLRLEKQAADEASRAKSRFLADMSHEIRTPINAILGMNEMILRESENKQIQGYSQNIKQSGHNLLQLINGILDFSKIEDGKMEILPIRYSVSDQIAYFMNAISKRAASKNLKLEFCIDPTLPLELNGDDTRINQVIINLLTNAVKYTKKGTVTFTMQAKEKQEKDGSMLIYYEVKDTGIGIRQEDMEKLFQSFERLDVDKNRNIEGTGLGMAITVRLLALMGSKLEVQSVYGEGSVFSFTLRQKIENMTPLGDYKKAIEEVKEYDVYKESFHAPKARILVVDDTKMNIVVIENLLKKTGMQIDTTLTGQESIRLCDENEYDVILMDQRMPVMDGTEALKQIRDSKKGRNQNTPIICLTADVVSGAKDRYISLGFSDYMMKPVDGADLEKMLQKYLPPEKVEKQKSDTNPASSDDAGNTDTSGLLAALEAIGVNTAQGLTFSANDMQMYKELLRAYAEESEEKTQNLKTGFETKDWENYGIYVHSLKSTSKSIGATQLSELAAASEAAAKDGDEKLLQKNHETIMTMYETITNTLKADPDLLGDSMAIKEEEILEFPPEA